MFTPHPEVEIYAWMVSELVQRLRAFGPVEMRARATCPLLGQALERNGFLLKSREPVHFWSNQPLDLPEPLNLCGDIADKAVLPYDLG